MLTAEQQRVKAAAEALNDSFPTAGHSYVLTCRRQFPAIDGPDELAYYRRVADEAEALVALVTAGRRPDTGQQSPS